MGRLVLVGDYVDSARHHLDGEPIHCGTGLELLLPGGRWVPVRFEIYRDRDGAPVPLLYMSVGGEWESWRPPPGHKEGDEVQVTCDGWSEREPCTRDADCACNGTGKRWRQILGPGAHQVVLRELDGCELRWPQRGAR